MSRRIPIAAAKRIAAEYCQRQVIVVTWDGALTHVVTYGRSLEDCDQARKAATASSKRWDGLRRCRLNRRV